MTIRTMLAAAAVALTGSLAATPAVADPPDFQRAKLRATATLDGRVSPTRDRDALGFTNFVRKRERVRVICQRYGGDAYGSKLWDLVAHRGFVLYVPDRYIRTGTNGRSPKLRACGRADRKRVIEPDYSPDPFD